MIRLIATDLDGTLLCHGDTIHPDNLDALREAMRQGVRFTVASGRTAASCSVLLRRHGLAEAGIIAVNGCHVMDRPYGETLVRHHMDPEAALAVMEILLDSGLYAGIFSDDTLVYATEAWRQRFASGPEGANNAKLLAEAGLTLLAGREAVLRAVEHGPMKAICAHGPGEEAAFQAVCEACAKIPGIHITSSWENNIEIMPVGVDKGTALAELAARHGIAREEVLAFGDNDNDLPMLAWAGHAFAMGNALEVVKQAVPRVTGACDAGGVAQGIRAML